MEIVDVGLSETQPVNDGIDSRQCPSGTSKIATRLLEQNHRIGQLSLF